MNRETRIGIGIVALLGVIVAFFLLVGALAEPRPDLDPLSVEEVLADGDPADRWGRRELHIAGWYAELDADCEGDDGGADADVAWLQRDCPLRVLLPEQPAEDVTQDEVIRDGIRLAAPLDRVFPSRAEPTGANLRFQQLVFVGRFDDPVAADCVPDRVERCRSTFVPTDYDELVR